MRGIGNLIIGLIFIVGGMSGRLVLKGTHSGGALAFVGLILCVLGGVQLAKSSGAPQG
jgi:hypothetical protein